MYSMMFRVMGFDGHRQRVSFRPSFVSPSNGGIY